VRAAVADSVAAASTAAVDKDALRKAILEVLSQDHFMAQVAAAYERAVAARPAPTARPAPAAATAAATARPPPAAATGQASPGGGKGRRHGRAQGKRNGKPPART
jgi:hypothetical protein